MKRLFLIGQTELQNKQNDSTEKVRENEDGTRAVDKYKVNVMANAACVDLLVWAICDETGTLYYFYSENHNKQVGVCVETKNLNLISDHV